MQYVGAAGVATQLMVTREHYNTLKHFQLEKKIGQGQFSVVFKAHSLVDGECVALKKIQVSLCIHVHMIMYM